MSSTYYSSKRKNPTSSSSLPPVAHDDEAPKRPSKAARKDEEQDDADSGNESPSPSSSIPLSAPAGRTNSSSMSGVSTSSLHHHPKVIVVLVKAALETTKTKTGYELLSADTHKGTLNRLKKNPSEYRPDIVHQCLLTLLDSPLNKAGLLKVYIQTEKNLLIEVNPSIRIPRTFKRFAGLMVQLLHKLKIRSADSPEVLLRVIRNPIEDHLPAGSLKLGTSVQGELVDIRELASAVCENSTDPTTLKYPIVFCFGSHAVGPADVQWTERSISVSKYPLSASVALGRVMNAFEGQWKIL